MPNWCYNAISVYGPDADVREFISGLTDEDGRTKSLLDTYAPLEGEWEYGKAVEHWGTKWADRPDEDARWETPVAMFSGLSTSYINVETAWVPPIEGLAKVSERWPTLHLTCFATEEMGEFVATSIVHNGTVVFDRSAGYPEGCDLTDDSDDAWERSSQAERDFECQMSDDLDNRVIDLLG